MRPTDAVLPIKPIVTRGEVPRAVPLRDGVEAAYNTVNVMDAPTSENMVRA